MMHPSNNRLRVTASLLLVLGAHIGLGILALNWQVKAVAVELPPAAMLIELPPQPAVAPPPAPAALVEPAPAPKVEVPVVAKPKLVLEKPKPKPKPKPVVKQLKPTPTPPVPAAKPVEQTTPTATTAPVAQQPSTSSATAAAKASWQSQLLSHLARHKRYPDEARRRGIQGTSQVRFNLDRAGGVLSVELAKSSGNNALDQATLAMIRRASPVPKPPAEMLSNGQLEIVAPFIYALERR